MRGDLTIRTVKTASGTSAVQIIRYERGKRIVVKHVGSAHTDDEYKALYREAEFIKEQLCIQPSLFFLEDSHSPLLHADHLHLHSVTHLFAYESLRCCCRRCGLHSLPKLYQDLALMRIIEPTSKLRAIELLKRYFDVSYAERTVYRNLSNLMHHKETIEQAAYKTACAHFGESFALVLYDVTTLYFESHKEDDELLAKGFSKDNKSKQPQIVVGLLVTSQGFPLMHEVYKGNTFEGHTMLNIVKQFQKRHTEAKPIIVADAAMLSDDNMSTLETEGYHYIVGARLANTAQSFINAITSILKHEEGCSVRLSYPKRAYDVICSYSEKRYKKDQRAFDQQIVRAKNLIARNEPGRRAKFVKKSTTNKTTLIFNEELKEKTIAPTFRKTDFQMKRWLRITMIFGGLNKRFVCQKRILEHDLFFIINTMLLKLMF
jgi:transposase